MAKIRTVLGDIAPEELGFCDMHEHTFTDMKAFKWKFPLSIPAMLGGIKNYQGGADLGEEGERRKNLGIEPPTEQQDFSGVFSAFSIPKDSPVNQYSDMDLYTKELQEFKKYGGSAMCDCSPSMRGDDSQLIELSKAAGIHIIGTKGYYTKVFISKRDLKKGQQYMTDQLVEYAKNGDGKTDMRPGFLKCAVSVVDKQGNVCLEEMTAVRATAAAARLSGLPVHIHTQFPLRPAHIETVADVLEHEVGIDPDRVLFCHMDGTSTSAAARINEFGFDQEFLMRLCDRGFHLGIDTWGTKRGLDEDPEYQIQLRLNILNEMAKAGYADKMTLGCDVMSKLNTTICGEYGYTLHPRYTRSLVERGYLSEELYHQVTVTNPASFMSI